MTNSEKVSACQKFFDELAFMLEKTHTKIPSCNKDISAYLVPSGTEEQVSYYGKPMNSFRISDHWNWYSSLKKCNKPHYIQCYSVDAPRPVRRVDIAKASEPRFAIQVSYFGDDSKYHCIYGERFNQKTKQWEWIEQPVSRAVSIMKGEKQ